MNPECLLLVQEEDLLLVQEEDLLLAQEEDLLLVQEGDLPTKFGRIWTKLRQSYDEVTTKIGSFLRSFYEDRGPSNEVSTKIGVPKGQSRLPADAI